MPILTVPRARPSALLDPLEQLDGGRDLLRAVELRLDDVDAARAAVRELAAAVEVMLRGKHRDHRVEEAFRDLVAVRVEDCIRVHVDADVSHQHEAAPGKLDGAAAGGAVGAVGVQAPDDLPAPLGERRFEGALHQPQPVAVHLRLVLGVDGGDRVLAVFDGGDRRLDHDVLDAGRAQVPDLVLGVDVQLDVQPVVPQQHAGELPGALPVPRELPGVREPRPRAAGEDGLQLDAIAPAFAQGVLDDGGVRSAREGGRPVEEVVRPRDHAAASFGVEPPDPESSSPRGMTSVPYSAS